jgi:hypothetical protein
MSKCGRAHICSDKLHLLRQLWIHQGRKLHWLEKVAMTRFRALPLATTRESTWRQRSRPPPVRLPRWQTRMSRAHLPSQKRKTAMTRAKRRDRCISGCIAGNILTPVQHILLQHRDARDNLDEPSPISCSLRWRHQLRLLKSRMRKIQPHFLPWIRVTSFCNKRRLPRA